jgi:NAD(P)-dependent dehydrogenase (short-subunit alcohol dehydrogenase family)
VPEEIISSLSVASTAPKRWMITGASSGLGRALAIAALARGDLVAGTVRSEAAIDEFKALSPGRAIGVLMDVTDAASVQAGIRAAESALGGIDVLVNNAGYGLVGAVEEVSLDEMRAQFEACVFGAVAVMQAALPAMRARRAGHIINITSVSGLVGWASLGIYTGAKFALEGISETLAQEVAPLGLKVTMIEPGGFRTAFATSSRAEAAKRIDDYDASVGVNRRTLAEHAGHERGDPARAAAAILAVADAAAPPLRLLLGPDALAYLDYKLAALAAEVEAWKWLSVSTDFQK